MTRGLGEGDKAMNARTRDVILGAALLGIAAFYFHASYGIRVFADLATFSVNSRTIPQLYAALLAVLSLVLTAQALCRKPEGGGPAGPDAERTKRPSVRLAELRNKYVPVLLTFVLMALYAGAMNWLGFVVSSALYVFFQILVLTPKNGRNAKLFLVAAVVALFGSMLVDYLFSNHLSLVLPRGVFAR